MNGRNRNGNKLAVTMIVVIVVGVLGFIAFFVVPTIFGPRM